MGREIPDLSEDDDSEAKPIGTKEVPSPPQKPSKAPAAEKSSRPKAPTDPDTLTADLPFSRDELPSDEDEATTRAAKHPVEDKEKKKEEEREETAPLIAASARPPVARPVVKKAPASPAAPAASAARPARPAEAPRPPAPAVLPAPPAPARTSHVPAPPPAMAQAPAREVPPPASVHPTPSVRPAIEKASSKTVTTIPPSAFASPQPRVGFEFKRARAYAFALDDAGLPVLLGSGRFSRLYLGHERWEESATHQSRPVVIKLLLDDLEEDETSRFRQERALLEYMQGHPSIVELLASGTLTANELPDSLRISCAGDFLVLEKLDMNLSERLKGPRDPSAKEDLAALGVRERLGRVLEYIIPVASAIEFAHIVRNVSHRDINPSNVLLKLPDPKLAGSKLRVTLADFSAARLDEREGMTRIGAAVPGTMYFQSPEQETNLLGILVTVKRGSRDVEYFEDFFVDIAKNDRFSVVNRDKQYVIKQVDRTKKRFVLETPFAEDSEEQIRANVQKRVGRPADIYAIGALFYYLMSGAVRNPKALNDSLRKFEEYDRRDGEDTIEAFLASEYEAMQAAKGQSDEPGGSGLFRFQHYLDANDVPLPLDAMRIIARCMIRNKTDSYCESADLETEAVSDVVRDLLALQQSFGPSVTGAISVRGARSTALAPYYGVKRAIARAWQRFAAMLGRMRRRR